MARVQVEPKTLELGYRRSAALRLDWQTDAPLEKLHGNPKAFVHLLERPGVVLRTFDHPMPEPWRPGGRQGYEIDLYQSALGPPLPPGTYLLTLGLYDDSWGYRWPLDTGGPDVGRREYRVATVVVPGGPPRAPRFEFSGEWERLSAGRDEQIPGRRWLKGRGKILVQGIEGSGVARLLLFLPGPGTVTLSSTCASGKEELLKPGHRWLGVPLDGRAREGACEIVFEPAGPTGAPASRAESRPLCLEILAWRPAS